ncbi:MAG: SDR family NAD(P)-dependent oxidoreductase [Anaeromyxobacter sp.]
MPTPRLAVVTGASSGIGADLARLVAARGRPVLAVARRLDRLEALAAEARQAGRAPIHPLALDVSADDAAPRLAEAAKALGGAAWLVNDAGVGAYGRFERSDPARVRAMLRTNCEAVALLTHALLPQLREAAAAGEPAAVLTVASVAGFQPTPHMAVYGATKAFALSFAEALHEELRGTGVLSAAFCPGPVATEFGAVAGTGTRFQEVPSVLTSAEAAADALRQLERREVVRVPTWLYGLTTSAVRFLPRPLVRRISGAVQKERST